MKRHQQRSGLHGKPRHRLSFTDCFSEPTAVFVVSPRYLHTADEKTSATRSHAEAASPKACAIVSLAGCVVASVKALTMLKSLPANWFRYLLNRSRFAHSPKLGWSHGSEHHKESRNDLREQPTSSDVNCSRKTLWVDLRREFENPCPHLKTLSLRRSRGFYNHDQRSSEPTVSDSRGRVVRSLGMAQTLLRPEQVDDLVAQYREGATLVELASVFGVNRRTVATHLTRREVTIRRGRFDPSRIHEAADLYLSGLTLVEVGMKVGAGPQAVRRALASHGVVIRPGGRCSSRFTASTAVGG